MMQVGIKYGFTIMIGYIYLLFALPAFKIEVKLVKSFPGQYGKVNFVDFAQQPSKESPALGLKHHTVDITLEIEKQLRDSHIATMSGNGQ